MTKICKSIDELIDRINPCWPSISEIRLEARKKGIWKEVQHELQKRYRTKKRMTNNTEPVFSDTELPAQELVKTFLYADDVSWSMNDLRKEAKSRGLKWSDIQREFRRIRHDSDAKLGEALSRNERILDVKYPHWEIGYEEGMSEAWFERMTRMEKAIEDMYFEKNISKMDIAYYTDMPIDEVDLTINSLQRRRNEG